MSRLLCLIGLHRWHPVGRVGHASRLIERCARPLCSETWRLR